MAVLSYRDLIVWQRAMELVKAAYRATRGFPADEMYGLTSQLRRAAVSIPSNIAEGRGRQSTNEFVQYLSIARGSLCEAETQVLIAQQLGYVSDQVATDFLALSDEVSRLTTGLIHSLCRK